MKRGKRNRERGALGGGRGANNICDLSEELREELSKDAASINARLVRPGPVPHADSDRLPQGGSSTLFSSEELTFN